MAGRELREVVIGGLSLLLGIPPLHGPLAECRIATSKTMGVTHQTRMGSLPNGGPTRKDSSDQKKKKKKTIAGSEAPKKLKVYILDPFLFLCEGKMYGSCPF